MVPISGADEVMGACRWGAVRPSVVLGAGLRLPEGLPAEKGLTILWKTVSRGRSQRGTRWRIALG